MIFSRKKQSFKNDMAPIGDVNSLSEWMSENGWNQNDANTHGKNSLKEITVFTCIKILADSVGMLPVQPYQRQKEIVTKASDHYLYNLLTLRPNQFMSASDFWKCIEVQRNVFGNSFVWIERAKVGRNAGRILGFYILDSTQVQIWVDTMGLVSGANTVWYIFTDNMGNQYRIESIDIMHFKGLSTNGISGISPVENLRNSIENAKSSSIFLNNSYKSGMSTKGIIQYVGDLNSTAENTFRTKFEQMSNGLDNANRVSLLPIGYQYQPIALTMVDAQFLENTNLTIRQLTAAYGIKPHQVNDLLKASYAMTSEANKEFYTDTLLAILTMYEQELTYKLFTTTEIASGFYFKFNVDIILRGDIKTRYEAYRTAIQAGFMAPNEARNSEDMAPKDGGDDLFMNGSMAPIANIEAPAPGKTTKNAKGGE